MTDNCFCFAPVDKSLQGRCRCELCKATFETQDLATKHYLHEHKVDITEHTKQLLPDNTNTNDGAECVTHVKLVLPPLTDSNNSRVGPDVTLPEKNAVNKDITNCSERVLDVAASADADHQSDIQNIPPPEGDISDAPVAADNVQALKFCFYKEEFKGSKFKYGRYTYSCMHCDHCVYSLSSLISHSRNLHADILSRPLAGGDSDTDTGGMGIVLTVAEYYTMQAKRKESERRQMKVRIKRNRKLSKSDHHSNRIYTCHTCQKIFTRARSLRLHTEIHRTERNYLCDECGKAFKSQIRLNAHRKVHREKLFHCSQCDFKSSVNTAIHVHRQQHRDGCVLCHVCGSAYTDKSTLKKHMQVHSLDRPYSCAFDGCTWRFKTQAMCKAHLRAHTSKGKFKCEMCGYLFRHKHHLQRHQSSMHAKGPTNSNSSNHLVALVSQSTIMQQHAQDKQDIAIEEPHVQISVEEIPEDPMDLPSAGSIQVVPVQVVVATDMQGTPITYEQVDVNQLNSASYQQVLIQTSQHSQIFSAGQE